MIKPHRPAISFYRSHVVHVRLRPRLHRFSYIVPFIVVDIDRLDEAGAASPLFSTGRFNLLSFYPGDHGARGKVSLRAHVEAQLREAGVTAPLAHIELVCMPRILGSAFNPISVYYCSAAEGLAAVIYEVRNTFGERHSYVVPVSASAGPSITPHERDKLFYVSPFMTMALRYRFYASLPGDRIDLKIIESDTGGAVLTALLTGKRIEPKSARLAALALGQCLGAVKVLGAIHFEALRLWLKGYRIHPRPAPPQPASFGEAGDFTSSKQAM